MILSFNIFSFLSHNGLSWAPQAHNRDQRVYVQIVDILPVATLNFVVDIFYIWCLVSYLQFYSFILPYNYDPICMNVQQFFMEFYVMPERFCASTIFLFKNQKSQNYVYAKVHPRHLEQTCFSNDQIQCLFTLVNAVFTLFTYHIFIYISDASYKTHYFHLLG